VTLAYRVPSSARPELLSLDRPVQARILRSLLGSPRLLVPRRTSKLKAMPDTALRVGDWRVIYTLLDDLLVVLD